MIHTPEYLIYKDVDSYAKIYPNTTKLYLYKHSRKIRIKGYESKRKTTKKHKMMNQNNTLESDNFTLEDSIRRTKTRLSDVVLCNRFDLFCTFTFAKDRQNVEHLKRQMSMWLAHQQKRTGKFEYLIVPEFHKDGKSIHFHALFKGYAGRLVDSGHKRPDGRPVYNLAGYRLGFSTATKIDLEGVPKVASYVKKYITKDMPIFSGKKRYWCSQGLIRPDKIENPLLFPSDHEKFTEEYQIDNDIIVKVAKERLNLISRD